MRGPARLLTEDELAHMGVSNKPQFSTLSFEKQQDSSAAATLGKGVEPVDAHAFGNEMGDALKALVAPHVESFDGYFGENGRLHRAVEGIAPRVLVDGHGNTIKLWYEEVRLGKPMLKSKERHAVSRQLYPAECRGRGITYGGQLEGVLCYQVNSDGPVLRLPRMLGACPVMVQSALCHLRGLTGPELIRRHEDDMEQGGYFIVNGIEKLVRLLVVTRRNHPMGIERNSYQKKGVGWSPYGVMIRCVRASAYLPERDDGKGMLEERVSFSDETAQTLTLHFVQDGMMQLRFSLRKQEYMVPLPLILNALTDTTDLQIYKAMTRHAGSEHAFYESSVESMLRLWSAMRTREGLMTRHDCLRYLGEKFAPIFRHDDTMTLEDIGTYLLDEHIYIHLSVPAGLGLSARSRMTTANVAKFDLLMLLARKLLSLVCGTSLPDNPDSPMHHEVLTGGNLLGIFLKEKLEESLNIVKLTINQAIGKGSLEDWQLDEGPLKKLLAGKLAGALDLGKKCTYFMATGNLSTMTGLDLQQVTGYTVVAERLNFYRFISHFRSVHRGAFFAELKTTTVRKLMPDSWGFLCPVHTPDGAPCGLLNHLAHQTRIVMDDAEKEIGSGKEMDLLALLIRLGVRAPGEDPLPVLLNGRLVGSITVDRAPAVVTTLRLHKAIPQLHHESAAKTSSNNFTLPWHLEIALIEPAAAVVGPYPGLFLATTPARLMRPVLQQPSGAIEWLGIYEQVFLSIATSTQDGKDFRELSHRELTETNILSVMGNMTPFSDYNQSPRNMYQCQMAKQSIGTPCHAFPYRADNKLFRLLTGQSPLVRPRLYERYISSITPSQDGVRRIRGTGFDAYPNGTNAVVAVIAYTGYDMEDAMILNKSAHERGFGMAYIYKTECVDLDGDIFKRNIALGKQCFLACFDEATLSAGHLDLDGLPPIGTTLKNGQPLAAIFDPIKQSHRYIRYKGFEDALVEHVLLLASEDDNALGARKVHIQLRLPRAPIIGDKFASRHGQKGVCSQRYPAVDLPFSSESGGLTPDIIINPNAFPSRMTIGMFIESMAGKAAALHAIPQDATPWKYLKTEKDTQGGGQDAASTETAYAYFGDQLKAAGYNYYGNETMISGITGRPLKLDIYLGLVYYQRLRHMVNDKFQVRTTGPIHNLTHQPIKGRKRAGGIRFGEMERDSLLAHGTAFLLHDRLMNCSDYTHMYACTSCGSILSILTTKDARATGHHKGSTPDVPPASAVCLTCPPPAKVVVLALPYVYKYLATELLSMNIHLSLQIN